MRRHSFAGRLNSRRAKVALVVASLALAFLAAGCLSSSGEVTESSAEVTDAAGGKNLFKGALAIKRGKVPLQDKAKALRPPPRKAFFNRGKAYADGCLLIGPGETESGRCTYGFPDSDTSVVIFGDSRALSYAPALTRLARKRDWKLVVLTKALCNIADRPFDASCDKWREGTLKRIRTVERPDLVLVGTSTSYILARGRETSESTMAKAFARTLKQLKSGGAKLVVMRDQSTAPFRRPGECVAEHRKSLLDCAWKPASRGGSRDYEKSAAKAVGARIIDTQSHVCRPKLCPSVIGNVVVYRDLNHYSAVFMGTLTPWIGQQLPRHP
jgi:hypothetical protein